MKRTIILLAALIMLTGMATAQQHQGEGLVDSVIITSTNSAQDTVIASGPSRKLGIPILHVEGESVPESTQNSLENLQPSNIVIIGGPEVVNPELESELGEYASNSTIRLWGITATETSTEVSQYYWPEGSDQAAIVHTAQQTQLDELIGIVNEIEAGNPILISDEDSISAESLTELQRLGTQEVSLYTTQQEDIDISSLRDVVDEVNLQQGTLEQLLEALGQERINQIMTNIQPTDTLILAAGQNSTGQITTLPYLTDTYVYGIQTEAQIDSAVELVQQAPTDEIWVTGYPELVNDVETIVEDTTGKELRVIEGGQLEISQQVIQRKIAVIELAQEELYQTWLNNVQSSTQLQISAESELEEARDVIDQNAPQESQNQLNQAEQAYQNGNWFEARKLAVQAASQAEIAAYTDLMSSPENGTLSDNETETQTEDGILE